MLVAVEGLDGSGKSTLARNLKGMLDREGVDAILTSEPTNGPIGRAIKAYLGGEGERDIVLEALMFAADRIWHLHHLVMPALEEGRLVVTDRYKYSSLAYQGGGEISRGWVEEINRFAPEADLALFLDVDPEICMRRLEETGRKASRMESLEIQWEIYRRYLDLVEEGRLVRIDGREDEETVAEEAFKIILERLKRGDRR